MSLILQLVFVLLVFSSSHAEVVDRMVVVVNKQIILQSELEQAAHVEFLLQGKPLSRLDDAGMQAVLERLIDQALLQQQIVNTEVLDPSPEELAVRLHEVRAQIPEGPDEQKWQAMLQSYGVTERDVETQIVSQLRILRFVDLRFRTLAHADRTEVNAYYQEKFLPELRKKGAPELPLTQVAPKIEQILTEQRIDDLLSGWLQTLRSQSNIRRLSPESKPSAGASK